MYDDDDNIHEFGWWIGNVFVLNLFILIYAGGNNPFSNLEKTSVLQETRMFNETPVNARKCTHILTKILYLINQVGKREGWYSENG